MMVGDEEAIYDKMYSFYTLIIIACIRHFNIISNKRAVSCSYLRHIKVRVSHTKSYSFFSCIFNKLTKNAWKHDIFNL